MTTARALAACAALLLGCGGSSTGGQTPVVVELRSDGEAPSAVPPAKLDPSPARNDQTEQAAAPVAWAASPEDALARARREGRPLLVFVRAEWSTAALTMERHVLLSPAVQRAAKPFVAARLDATDDTSSAAGYWLQTLGVVAVPAVVLVAPSGSRREVIDGFVEAEELTRRLNEFLSDN